MEATNGVLGRLHHGSKTQPDLLVTNHLFTRFSRRKISRREITLRLSFCAAESLQQIQGWCQEEKEKDAELFKMNISTFVGAFRGMQSYSQPK